MSKLVSIEEFKIRGKYIYNDKYDYSLSIFTQVLNKMIIICPIHGTFEKSYADHIHHKQGCSKCSKKYRRTTEDFINDSIKIHGNIYDYSLVKFQSLKKEVEIICKKHGMFKQLPKSHLRSFGCKQCSMSRGERVVERILIENKINFNFNFKFKDCKNILTLPFDFYLPDHNICIEFDGRQHFQSSERFGGEIQFKKTQINDLIKDQYCDLNNIKLIRIKHNTTSSYISLKDIQINI